MLSNQEAATLRRMLDQINTLEEKIASLQIQGDRPPAFAGQYPGKPIPHTEGVEVNIGANTNPASGNITIAADGPFIASRILFAYRPTAGNLTGFWRPISHCMDYAPAGVDVIDFTWQYQVSGSHRLRQNIPVPSAMPHRAEEGNGAWEFFVQDVIDPTATITVTVTPTIAPTHAGVMYIGFHGCYVLK